MELTAWQKKSIHVSEKRFFVKIEAGPAPGGNPCIYHNMDFPFEIFNKWKWYFDYRAALYKVQHPRHYVNLRTGNYDYTPSQEQAEIDLRNKIIGKKRVISKYQNSLRLARQTWNQLFPIEEDSYYKRAVAKVERTELELQELIQEQKLFT